MTDLLVNVVHPGNPFSADPDGIVTVQRNFISASPPGFSFDYWGVGRPGVDAPDEGRPRFREVLSSRTQRPWVPLSLAFGARVAMLRRPLGTGVIRFDRIESAVPLWGLRAPKALFLHTWNVRDIRDPASESRWRRIAPAYDALFGRIVRTMDAVYVLRPDMAEDLRARMPSIAPRIHAFSVPVDVETFRPLPADEMAARRRELEAATGVPAGARLVLFAGRLEGQKRPLAIPEVAARLAADGGEQVHFLIAGTGTLDQQLRAGIGRLAPGLVHMIPPVPQAELRGLMAASDALLLPSAFEGLPNVLLESLACGTPVVAARAPGRVAEILTDRRLGSVVDPTPQGLAAGIREVLATGVEGVAVRRTMAERFSPAAVNGPIYAEFERLARKG